MKIYSRLILILAALTFVFASCSKGEPDASISTLSATVDAASFASTTVETRLDTSTSSSNKKQLTLTATSGLQTIVIVLNDYNENLPLGSYSINTRRALASYNNGATEDLAVSGQVQVTSASRSLINGTADFTTQSGAQISNGKFSVVITP